MPEREIRGFPFRPGYACTIPEGWTPIQALDVKGDVLVICMKDAPYPVAPSPIPTPEPIVPAEPVAPTPEPSAPEEGFSHA